MRLASADRRDGAGTHTGIGLGTKRVRPLLGPDVTHGGGHIGGARIALYRVCVTRHFRDGQRVCLLASRFAQGYTGADMDRGASPEVREGKCDPAISAI